MGKCYNGKLKSIEETKSLHFSLHSNYSCLHIRATDIGLCPSPQLHQSSIVLQNRPRDAAQTVHLVGQRIFRVRTHGNHIPFVPEVLLVLSGILPLF